MLNYNAYLKLFKKVKNLNRHFSKYIPMAKKYTKRCSTSGLPGGAVVKNPPANAGDTGSSPGLGRSHMLRSN